jgi:hypothetical protein
MQVVLVYDVPVERQGPLLFVESLYPGRREVGGGEKEPRFAANKTRRRVGKQR